MVRPPRVALSPKKREEKPSKEDGGKRLMVSFLKKRNESSRGIDT